MGGMGGVLVNSHCSVMLLSVFRGAGGGKCPEEEHTTCSGGPTIVIVTSAVYGERHYFII
jgi:hypothetical protein